MDIVDHSVDRVLDLLGLAGRAGAAVGSDAEMKMRKARKSLIAFQGARGAFSEEAARKLLGPNAAVLPCERFEDVFRSLKEGRTIGRGGADREHTGGLGARELRPPAEFRAADRRRDQRAHRAQLDRAAGGSVFEDPAGLFASGGAESVPGFLRRQSADRAHSVLRHGGQRQDGHRGRADGCGGHRLVGRGRDLWRADSAAVDRERPAELHAVFPAAAAGVSRSGIRSARPRTRRGRRRWCSGRATCPARCSAR